MACRLVCAKTLPELMLLSTWHLDKNFSFFFNKLQDFSFKKLHLKISSAKWRPFCPGRDASNTVNTAVVSNGTRCRAARPFLPKLIRRRLISSFIITGQYPRLDFNNNISDKLLYKWPWYKWLTWHGTTWHVGHQWYLQWMLLFAKALFCLGIMMSYQESTFYINIHFR